jgi:hypothetical protein
MYIIYFRSDRRPRKFRRINSLKRHLISVHFKHMTNGTAIHYTLHSSKTVAAFTDVTTFLYHATTVHDYDPKIQQCYLQQRRRLRSGNVWSAKDLKIKITDSSSDSTTDSTADSTTDIIMSKTQTPISSIDSDTLLNINPRLLTDRAKIEIVRLFWPVSTQTTDMCLRNR